MHRPCWPGVIRRGGPRLGGGLLAVLLLAACDSNTPPTPTPIPALTATAPAPATLTAPPTTAPPSAPTSTTGPQLNATTAPPAATPTHPAALVPTVTLRPTTAPPLPPTLRPTAAATLRPPTLPATAAVPPTTAPPQPATPTPNPQPPTPPAGVDPHRVAGDLSQVSRGVRGKHQVALTFDAGAGRGQPEDILRTLQDHNVHITFFLTGQWIEQNPDAARAIAAGGHEIANHSYSHPSFFKITDAQMAEQIDKAEALIHDTTGQTAQPYFRAPYGDTNDHVDAVIRAHGYRDFLWTLDSLDSVGKPKTADFIYNRICNTDWLEMDGAIFLQHIAAPASVEALPRILDTLAARGWKVVTLTELLTP